MRFPAAIVGAFCLLSAASAEAQTAVPDLYSNPEYVKLPDGRRMAFYCQGHGAPMVVFDSGAGGRARNWSKVQPEIAKTNRACAYDRAGYDKSDPGPMPRHAANVVADLDQALHSMGEAGPIVLVAHSVGGFHARLFVNLHREEVAGMVLVDPSQNGGEMPYVAVSPTLARSFGKDGDGGECIWASAAGRLRPGDPLYVTCGSPPPGSLMTKAEMAQAVTSEAMSQVLSTAQVLGSQKSYGDLPLIVLTADPSWNPLKLPEAELKAVQKVDLDGQKAMAAQSRRGVAGVKIGSVADYIAVLALSRWQGLEHCNSMPTILNLMADDCSDTAPEATTAADIGLLTGLYASAPRDLGAFQRMTIASRLRTEVQRDDLNRPH
jgi:pimeloyl-ACP methyl ester carboxylesterase